MVDNVYKRAAASLDSSSTELPFYFPESVYESIPHSGAAPSPSSEKDDVKTATDFISNRLSLGESDFKIPVYSEFEHTLEYVELPDGKVVYAYTFQLRDNPLTKWVQVWCDTTTGKVIQTIDFANKATYKVIPIPRRDPSEGFAIVFDPEVIDSSPNGWTDGKATEGFDSTKPPGTVENTATTAVNLFYITNVMHDISYQYDFTESAGNFQKDNFGKGGRGNDAVAVNVFYPSAGTDNARFFTPSDGQPGEMKHVSLH
ncbi:hypothetical protein BASA60_008308 [Batrachochytrium salamandrivorans]|nr:hypothetical protein BASA60_008308 [Batrachochytrium salamandrivorans]